MALTFSDSAEQALWRARTDARRARHPYIATEHVVLGLLRQRSSMASVVLRRLGVTAPKVARRVQELIGGRVAEDPRSCEPLLTARVERIVRRAVQQATVSGSSRLCTEHLLVELLVDGEGLGAGVINECGVTVDVVRTEVARATARGISEP